MSTLKQHRWFQCEIDFVANFFDHDEWEAQPKTFDLIDTTYRPDFYDKRRDVYIEVVGSPSAYSMGKRKYWKFRVLYPKIKFELRRPSGEIFVPWDRLEDTFMMLAFRYQLLKDLGLSIDELAEGKVDLDFVLAEIRALSTKKAVNG